MTQPTSIVHVLIVSKTTKHQLPQQANERVATILSGARIGQHLACKRVIELAIGRRGWCYQHACRMSLEGIVSMRLSARYRSVPRDWIKVKNSNTRP
jgi:ATP-dependent DNA ligase